MWIQVSGDSDYEEAEVNPVRAVDPEGKTVTLKEASSNGWISTLFVFSNFTVSPCVSIHYV
jgi:hypothetical protein